MEYTYAINILDIFNLFKYISNTSNITSEDFGQHKSLVLIPHKEIKFLRS